MCPRFYIQPYCKSPHSGASRKLCIDVPIWFSVLLSSVKVNFKDNSPSNQVNETCWSLSQTIILFVCLFVCLTLVNAIMVSEENRSLEMQRPQYLKKKKTIVCLCNEETFISLTYSVN